MTKIYTRCFQASLYLTPEGGISNLVPTEGWATPDAVPRTPPYYIYNMYDIDEEDTGYLIEIDLIEVEKTVTEKVVDRVRIL